MTWIVFAIFAVLMEMLSIETDLRQQMLQISLSWSLIPQSVARVADQSSLRDYSCRIGNEGATVAKISMLKNSFSKNAFLYRISKFWIKKSTSNKQAGKGSGSSIILQIDGIQGIVFQQQRYY